MKLVAVTSCPTGIAHTYMAAEALEIAARAAGHEIRVETQGAAGSNPIDPEYLATADAAIFAADVEVRDRERFAHLPTIAVGVKKAISDSPALIAAAIQKAQSAPAGSPAAAAASLATKVEQNASVGVRIRQWLMTGVSYMIPFVAAGGIMIALSFMIGGYKIVDVPLTEVVRHFHVFSKNDWAALLFQTGAASFAFLVPILAGFIAYAIADRPGLVPGIVGGSLAATIGAGFLGGIAAGFIGGFTALYISRVKVGKGLRGVMPVVVIPLLSTFVTGLAMLVVIGRPIKAAADGLSHWLNSLTGTNLILLGVILGLMMAFDLGGPVNKVAYTFATTGLAAAGTASASGPNLKIMAAVMAAGMTPPLGMALATTIRKNLFTEPELENGRAAWLLGASFISEGAIPFAAGDPLRVIPSSMVGSAVTGALVMAFGNTLRAPHGGIWVTPLIGKPLLYVLAIIVGTVVTAACVVALKGLRKTNRAAAPSGVAESVAA
jgi:fructose PTS system EIIBC or EIIC component